MPRPVKARRVCCIPGTTCFKPAGQGRRHIAKELQNPENIILSIDEYEVIRLIDYEGLNQEETANQMNVARTTVQAIYREAREKLARMLVESKPVIITGGSYRLCNGHENCLYRNCSQTDKMMTREALALENAVQNTENEKEKNNMKIVIPVDKADKNTTISNVFGRADYYLVYDENADSYDFIENPVKDNPSGAGIKAAETIVNTGAKVLLSPRCGIKAGKVLDAADFKIYQTVGDDLQENLKKYKKGDLSILEKSPGRHGGK